MMKRIILFGLSAILIIIATACGSDKPAVLFNKHPITKDNIMDYSSVFKPGTRIYFVVLMPKPQKSRYLYIQLIKKDNDQERLGYQLYWSNTIRLKDEHMYYYDDYVVVNQTGAYVMKVYSKDKPKDPLAMAQFFVRD